jgi:adenine/guanine phosphoribosyltransferase-like PRPP-binding protein
MFLISLAMGKGYSMFRNGSRNMFLCNPLDKESTIDRKISEQEACRQIAGSRNNTLCQSPDVIVFALPRGGIPVAYEVARTLNVPLDVFIVRKLGLPG